MTEVLGTHLHRSVPLCAFVTLNRERLRAATSPGGGSLRALLWAVALGRPLSDAAACRNRQVPIASARPVVKVVGETRDSLSPATARKERAVSEEVFVFGLLGLGAAAGLLSRWGPCTTGRPCSCPCSWRPSASASASRSAEGI